MPRGRAAGGAQRPSLPPAGGVRGAGAEKCARTASGKCYLKGTVQALESGSWMTGRFHGVGAGAGAGAGSPRQVDALCSQSESKAPPHSPAPDSSLCKAHSPRAVGQTQCLSGEGHRAALG